MECGPGPRAFPRPVRLEAATVAGAAEATHEGRPKIRIARDFAGATCSNLQYLHRVTLIESQRARAIGRALLGWYSKHQRDLPWRRSLDPYAVWVSEMMLQQTQVTTVIPYFQHWMQRFPDVQALADADESDVLHAWQGLGYYSRARNLRRAAQEIVRRHEGRLPDSVVELRKLPGIGPYSAGAIASIAYGRREPLVDGNVIRVLTRLCALRGDPSRAPLKTELWEVARTLLPTQRPGDFNQALMELGATVCTPRAPRCEACPLQSQCWAREQQLVQELPELPARPKATPVQMVALVARRGERVLVEKLGSDAPRWAGMWLFPQLETGAGETSEQAAKRALSAAAALSCGTTSLLCVVRHTVTRFRITLSAYVTRAPHGVACSPTGAELSWKRADELASLAMPKAHRAIANFLLAT